MDDGYIPLMMRSRPPEDEWEERLSANRKLLGKAVLRNADFFKPIIAESLVELCTGDGGIGAILLDLENPTKIIARLDEPLLAPHEKEREGYVPNVVYSCGAIIHNKELVIPYAMSDINSGIAVVEVKELIKRMHAVA